ncbi:hypothetical protein BLA27_24860 [Brucella cytisi]|uniref:Uncharacterized protein n=1 Tax=Brucella cytisi TaxID=407152 RepID=A0A1J6HCI9_9HYPH|nr:hypothetical protein BLA27_24860 [Brucella cytisi]
MKTTESHRHLHHHRAEIFPQRGERRGNGVIHMGLLSIIRRMALHEKQSIREISRRTGLTRNTIAKYLSADIIEPTFRAPERPSKLDGIAKLFDRSVSSI